MSFTPEMLQSMGQWGASQGGFTSGMMSIGQAASQIAQGREAKAIGDAEAAQFTARGNMSMAVGSLQAGRMRQSIDRLKSRQKAVAAASGFTSTDPTAAAISDDTERDGSVQVRLMTAQAEDEANQDFYRARLRKQAGASQQTASLFEGLTTLVNGNRDWRARFGRAGAAGGDTPGADANAGAGVAQPPPFMDDWAGAGAGRY